MKKRLPIILVFTLLLCSMVVPSSAAQETYTYRYSDVTYTEVGPVEVETVLTVYDTFARSSTKRVQATQTVKYSGEVIAEVTLTATFGYNGTVSWVIGSSSSHTTYNGWSYGSESITSSGGTANLSAILTHLLHGRLAINISMTCSPTGEIS